MSHLRLVAPIKDRFEPEIARFAFIRVAEDIFLCHDGKCDLAADFPQARTELDRWVDLAGGGETSQLRWPLRRSSATPPGAA